MDDPVTDVVIVSEPRHCPDGYTVLTECPCGHNAQLWEKVYGGADNTRYLCFTKNPINNKDLVVETMYIPGFGVRYLKPGFEIIDRTVEGDREPLRHKQLAVKKVPRKDATKIVADIVVAKGKDSISKNFTKLEKTNGVRICFRQENYTPSTSSKKPKTTVDDIAVGTKNISLGKSRLRSHTHHIAPALKDEKRPSAMPKLPSLPSSTVHKPPSPPLQPVVEEAATVQLVSTLASAPQPSVHQSAPSQPGDQSVSEQLQSRAPSNYPPTGYDSRYPPQSSGYPPQSLGYPQQSSGYPSQSTSYLQQTSGYPQQSSGYPPQAYPSQVGYPAYQTVGVPPTTPPSAVGYDTSIGFNVGGGGNTYPPPQAQCPPAQYGGPSGQYPPQYPLATALGQSTYPLSTNTHTDIGFKL